MNIQTDLLIIGAGPFGLSMAAYAKRFNLDFLIVGKPMEFWKNNMPSGMYLRSGTDWHLDPFEEITMTRYLEQHNITPDEVNPLPIDTYIRYVEWFRSENRIDTIDAYVLKLDHYQKEAYPFKALLDNDSIIESKAVVVAIGFGYFKYIPEEMILNLPGNKYSHTSELIDFADLNSRNCLILGGRQSAYEWAMLISRAGANKIHIVHRHKTPEFTESDWSWVNPILDVMVDDPDYYPSLSEKEKDYISRRFWIEGRLKLEPWLAKVSKDEKISIHPETSILSLTMRDNLQVCALLDKEINLLVDHVIFATGFKVNLGNIKFLTSGNIWNGLKTVNGYPKLEAGLNSGIPGLYFTSLPATRDFGPFFGFTVSCKASAKIIGSHIIKHYLDIN